MVRKLERPVSDVCHLFDPLPQILKNVRYKSGQPLKDQRVVEAIAASQAALGTHGRLVIRPSGTEPVIRVMAEGDDRKIVEQAVDDVVSALGQAAA